MGQQQTQRQLQVGEQVKRALAGCMQEMDFYNIDPATCSLMEVRMSSDLRLAYVYVVIAQETERDSKIACLNQLAPVIQKSLARKVRLKFTPKLKFIIDESFDKAWRLDTLIRSTSDQISQQDAHNPITTIIDLKTPEKESE